MRQGHRALLFLGVVYIVGTAALYHGTLYSAGLAAQESTQAAATFFVQSITANGLRLVYSGTSPSRVPKHEAVPNSKKIRVLVVPGHEPTYGGTAYKSYTERDIAVEIADELAALIASNSRYEVVVARSKAAWHPNLERYFTEHKEEINEFRATQTALMQQYLASGEIAPAGAGQVLHNFAPEETAYHLYGINKWAADNEIAITLHIHINDFAGRRGGGLGKYSGFAIYVPEHQYSNAAASYELAEHIKERLAAYHPTSDLPGERGGVIEDQELIAIGSHNSADAASILVEYGYIYERQFASEVRSIAARDYAYATYLGLQDFFDDTLLSRFGTNVLPYTWGATLIQETIGPDIYAMQAALRRLGYYPPQGRSFNDCPVSGYFGPCTGESIRAFQIAQGLPPSGVLDTAAQAALTGALLED